MDPILYFILLSILPLAYKLSFWLYVVQLKEYRCDRLKDYLKTPQWKKSSFQFLVLAGIGCVEIYWGIFTL